MAVKLRLMRMGKKKQPTYRVVAADSRAPRNGRFIEIIGIYEPRQEPSVVRIDNDRALHWLRHGAQPTERVEKLLRISGAWDSFRGPKAGQANAAAADAADSGQAEAAAAVADAGQAEAEAATDAADAGEAKAAAEAAGAGS